MRLAPSLLVAAVLIGCGQSQRSSPSSSKLVAVPLQPGEMLRVVTTTTLIGDVTAEIGGGQIELNVLMKPGQDPHSYDPGATDIARIESAHVILANGNYLEEGLLSVLESATPNVPIVEVSDGIDLLSAPDMPEHGGFDPHVWQDPANVKIWADNITATLSVLDPLNAVAYRQNAERYKKQLDDLDQYIRQQVARIPEVDRKLVTNHDALGYFARRYGFEIIGTIYGTAGEGAEPSAGELADLVDVIRRENARAIFVETILSEKQARTVAEEVGYPVEVVSLYTDSVGPPGSGVETYLTMMRANADAIVGAMGG